LKLPTKPWIGELQPYPPGKPIEEVEREYGVVDSIKLASNENPLGPSPKAIAALRDGAADVHLYPDGGAFYLRRALGDKLGVPPDWLLFGNGSNELIDLAARAFVGEGDEAVVAEHAFVIYAMAMQAQGGRARVVPARRYGHDLEAMAAAVTDRTRLVFLANPNNPTGTMFGEDEWRRFLAAVPPDVVVVLDEAYAEYVDDPDYPRSIAALREIGDERPLLVLRTFSKIYGLAGLRIGFAVGHPQLLDVLNRLRAPFNVNLLAQRAALAALADDEHLERTRQVNRAGMRQLGAGLRALGLDVVPSCANFLLVNVAPLGPVAAIYEELLRRGVIVRPVGVYGLPEHIRVTIGTEAENRRFLAALGEIAAAPAAGGAGGGVAV
jgi:histidinol-phosphate aminotransferase